MADSEQLEDAQVFLALGHPPFAGRHDQERNLDRADAREHVLDEAHVPGHIDEPDFDSRRQRGEREAEIDREPPSLLLGEAVGVGAGEREYE